MKSRYYIWGVILLSLIAIGGYYFYPQVFTQEKIDPRTDVLEGYKVYRNEDWRFELQYPEDWIIREPAFYSTVSKFNVAIEPARNPEAILINITPKDWIENAHDKMKQRGVLITETKLSGKTALTAKIEEGVGGPTKNYYVLINDSYWIHISIQDRQKEVFEGIISTFKFLE